MRTGLITILSIVAADEELLVIVIFFYEESGVHDVSVITSDPE